MLALRLDAALDQTGNLAALPGRQHITEQPGQQSAKHGVGQPLANRKSGLQADQQQVRLQQSGDGGGNRGVQITAQGKRMGHAAAERDDQEQHLGTGVGHQQRHHQQTAEHGARDAGIAALNGLRQVAAHHDHDGDQNPVFVRCPRQVQRHPIAHRHGECGAQRIAQGRGAPAQLPEQGFPAPLRGTDEQLPLVAHQAEFGGNVAARQRRHLDGLVIDVANAVGHAVQQGRCIGGVRADRLRCQRCRGWFPRRQHADQLRP